MPNGTASVCLNVPSSFGSVNSVAIGPRVSNRSISRYIGTPARAYARYFFVRSSRAFPRDVISTTSKASEASIGSLTSGSAAAMSSVGMTTRSGTYSFPSGATWTPRVW